MKRHIRHEQYKEALFEKQTFRHGMDILRSERHRIYGQQLNKVFLSPFDSKRSKRWIAKMGWTRWHMDTGMQSPRDVKPARGWMFTLRSRSTPEDPIRRKLGVLWHRKQLFPNKASLWGIIGLQVVQHGLVGLCHRASQPVHFKKPHRVSCPPATTLQFTGLVKIANADLGGDFLVFGPWYVPWSRQ